MRRAPESTATVAVSNFDLTSIIIYFDLHELIVVGHAFTNAALPRGAQVAAVIALVSPKCMGRP